MFSLSLRERLLVAVVLSAALLGAAVQHWRDARRESLVLPPSAAAQSAAVPGAPHYSLVNIPRGEHHP